VTRELVPLVEISRHRRWCSVRYARRLVAERRIPFHKVGGRVLLDLADLDVYAEAGRIEPPRRAGTGNRSRTPVGRPSNP
jgi:excisionase family DNA binding protein